jgi:hypothetical protein
MPSVARVTYMPLRALAVNVIAIYSRSRRKRRKVDSMTPIVREPKLWCHHNNALSMTHYPSFSPIVSSK